MSPPPVEGLVLRFFTGRDGLYLNCDDLTEYLAGVAMRCLKDGDNEGANLVAAIALALREEG